MEIKLAKQRGYRLLYFQPDPEDGERVCVGVLVRDGDRYSVLYDESFRRLACLAPASERKVLQWYLDALEDSLRSASHEQEKLILRRSEPQIVSSTERALLAPVTDGIKEQLLERFLLTRPGPSKVALEELDKGPKIEQQVSESIGKLLNEYLAEPIKITFDVKPKQIVGRPLPNVASIAVSVRLPGRTVLVDGVNLKLATPKNVISRVNRVTHAFWEYGRVEATSLFASDSLKRVAMVLDGLQDYSTAQRDAHDFALYQFKKESDLLFTDRARDGDKLRKLIAG